MLNSLTLKNFGPLSNLQWNDLGPINLVIGDNGSGKTFLLKALYVAVRTLEEYRRGNDQRSPSDILFEKLFWTFQVEKIGDLVTKGAESPLLFRAVIDERKFEYGFGRGTTRSIPSMESTVGPLSSNSIFLPAKEILSLLDIIRKSRETDKVFGFDDTYLDLARALQQPTTKGKNYPAFASARQDLESILGGRVEYDPVSREWQFRKGNQKFPIGVTAEGVRKIAILDTLLGNRYLSPGSTIFIDEPEAALHPVAISRLLDILVMLAEAGLQLFLASHSYFVVKKLFLIAQEKGMSIPVLSAVEEGWQMDDLRNGMPANAIIDESIRLYREEVDLALQ